jgi:hypothetical protein
MKALLESYDHHLKKLASVSPARRMRVTYGVMFPWMLAAMAGFILVGALGLPRNLGVWIVGPIVCVAAAGILYASGRVAKHGWQFDRTPTDPALREARGSDALIQALQRVTLHGLSNLTLSTRLQADLKLSPGDVSRLLNILSAENALGAEELDALKSSDMTIGALLKIMDRPDPHEASVSRPPHPTAL